jgi:uncharacterized membrane protein YphA (DoxX/SURF4 family)/thiol-disulfide isomerase/thioredoxin
VDFFVVLVVLLLAALFAVAGFAKLADLRGSRRVLVDFGVPAAFAPAGAVLLPLVEIATAVALVLHPTARWGAIAALVLLLAFVAGVANALRQGKDVDCGCFGRIYSATAGTATLVRNVVLTALALVVVVHGPGPAIDAWVAERSAAELAAIVLGIVAVGVLAFRLLRQTGAVEKTSEHLRDRLTDADAAPRPQGLPVGAIAPSFSLELLNGGTQTLDALLARGRPVVLVFVSPTCGPCNAVVPNLASWQERLADGVTITIITSGPLRANNEVWRAFPQADVLLDPDDGVSRAYRVTATPRSVRIDPDGRVAGVMVGGAARLEMLIRVALRRAARPASVLEPQPHGV